MLLIGHLQQQLEELFDANQVDLVLSGHVHAYARTCNVYNERCVDSASGGMTHVTLGEGCFCCWPLMLWLLIACLLGTGFLAVCIKACILIMFWLTHSASIAA